MRDCRLYTRAAAPSNGGRRRGCGAGVRAAASNGPGAAVPASAMGASQQVRRWTWPDSRSAMTSKGHFAVIREHEVTDSQQRICWNAGRRRGQAATPGAEARRGLAGQSSLLIAWQPLSEKSPRRRGPTGGRSPRRRPATLATDLWATHKRGTRAPDTRSGRVGAARGAGDLRYGYGARH